MNATENAPHFVAKPHGLDSASTDATSAGETSCEDEKSQSSNAGLDEEEREPFGEVRGANASASASGEACFESTNSLEQMLPNADDEKSASKRQRTSRLPHVRRQVMAKKKYRRNADGSYTKTRAVSEWDLDGDGALKEFASEQEFLEHEERCYLRRRRGEHPCRYHTLSQEQRALASAMDAHAEEHREIVCEVVEENTAAVLRGLGELGEKMERRLEAEQSERASGDERFAVRELVHECLKVGEIRELLETRGITAAERRCNKWSLASKVAILCPLAEVQEFLAARQNPNDAKRDRGTPSDQTTFPITKARKKIDDAR